MSCQAVVWVSPSMAITMASGATVSVRKPVPGSSSSLIAATSSTCQSVIGGVDQAEPCFPSTPPAMYSA